ncbi:MAG TPA: cytochrome c3 family protein, partial [Candidatus Eisenbacteria bacterium]|nr:cytochrome c3 family protein [Candidatus Eisenbacteria bacterium]
RGLAPLPRPWPEPPYESPCLECHEGIEERSGEIFGRRHAHAKHVVEQKIDCERCHRTHEEKPEGEVVRFDASGCESCHHRAADLRRPATCVPCHADIQKGTVESFRGKFSHSVHVEDEEIACGTCHVTAAGGVLGLQREACVECHDE